MNNESFQWLKWLSEMQALAQSGLTYASNEFDKERYLKLTATVAELAAHCTDKNVDTIKKIFSLQEGYATPKVDVRAYILQKGKVLLVKERSDDLWALPGGWVDVNESPAEAVIREVKEETGYDVSAVKLLALWDKLKHDHPPQWPHTYKCFFYCTIVGGKAQENLEISAVDFFALSHLPPLSTDRVTEKQLQQLYTLIAEDQPTQFD
jgi:ADP-ribose pyrophosphatase YjhB (NUDIX family)